MKSFDVIGLGLSTVDFLGIVGSLPDFDQIVLMNNFAKQGGGPVATAIITLARLGARCAYLGKVGDDEEGKYIHDDFIRFGVDDRSITNPRSHSPLSYVAIEQSTGKRAISFYPGDKVELLPNEINRELIADTKYLHLDGWFSTAAKQAAKWAKEEGVKVIMDGTIINPDSKELISLTDVLITDASFPFRITGINDPEKAGRVLLSMGPNLVIITLGSNGSLAVSSDEKWKQPAFTVPVVDTTGAGDVFHGAFIFGLINQWSMNRILTFASAVAAIKCTMIGGRSGIPTCERVEKFLLEQGYDN